MNILYMSIPEHWLHIWLRALTQSTRGCMSPPSPQGIYYPTFLPQESEVQNPCAPKRKRKAWCLCLLQMEFSVLHVPTTYPKPWFWLKTIVRIKRTNRSGTPYSHVMSALLECPDWCGACWVWIRADLNPAGERTKPSPAGWLVKSGSVNSNL